MRTLIGTAMGVVLLGSTHAYAGDPVLATEIVASGLNAVTYVASAPGDTSRLYAIQQNGVIRVIENGVLLPTPFLDIDSLVPNETFNGLLGIAFHPDFANNGYFYLHHPRGGGSSNRITIASYRVIGDPNVVDPGTREEILVLPYPAFPGHHVGGWIGFGPDGYLYIPLGDGNTTGGESGGGARAQSLSSVWGKVLRIDVNSDDFPADRDRDYAIPADNPFVGQGGDEAVWALGMRNPYRASFDAETGDFWIADVGLHAREEIDFQPAGSLGSENYGWNCSEGTLCSTNANCNCRTDNLTDPIFEYDHSLGCSITGGAVYRGCGIPGLEGTYFYGDWCTNRIWSLRYEGGMVVEAQDRTAELDPPGGVTFGSILSISEGPYGELYISDGSRIYRIIPAGGVVDDNSNGVPDSCEITDCNDDGTPDSRDPDCQPNGISDLCEILDGSGLDCNGNMVPDECEPFAAQRPMPDDSTDINNTVVACMDDTDCLNTSYCVPAPGGVSPGTCYIPKNRYISVDRNAGNAGATARRLSVQTQGGPIVLGWLNESVASSSLDGALVSHVVTDPAYSCWEDSVHLGDCHISPQRNYLIESIAIGLDIAPPSNYSEALELRTVDVWGDVIGVVAGGVASPPQGTASLTDAQQIVKGFQGTNTAPMAWLDLHPTSVNRVVNLSDAQQAVKGFQGNTFFDMPGTIDPCECSGLAPCP